MFDNIDLSKMGSMFEEMKEKAEQLEKENSKKEYTVKSGGGLVAIKINGSGEVLDVKIDDSLFEDKDSMNILLISAINDAIKLIENEKKNIVGKMFGNLGGLEGING